MVRGTMRQQQWVGGVQARIAQQQPKAVCTHYAGLSFNLAIKILVLFQLLEPKREGFLKAKTFVQTSS